MGSEPDRTPSAALNITLSPTLPRPSEMISDGLGSVHHTTPHRPIPPPPAIFDSVATFIMIYN